MIRIMMNLATLSSLVAAGLIAGWFFANVVAWYCADDEPVLGPRKPGRVTFAHQLQRGLLDISDTLGLDRFGNWSRRVWAWLGPRVSNPQLYAWSASVAAAFFASDPMTMMQRDPRAFIGIVLGVVVVSAVLKPFSVDGAPDRIPPPGAMGPGAAAELAAS